MKKMFYFLLLMCLIIPCACASGRTVDNTTVKNLDLNRYLGTWFEIARFDHSFERGVEFATANYILRDDGKVRVVNSGLKDGHYKESIGKAFLPDPAGEPARLRVSFFGPFYSDYRVLMLSEDYHYALVGSKSAKYLWILSRTPYVPEQVMEQILAEATRRGYDTSLLHWVDQGQGCDMKCCDETKCSDVKCSD